MSELQPLLFKAICAVYHEPAQLRLLAFTTLGDIPTDVAWTNAFDTVALDFVHSRPVRNQIVEVSEAVYEEGQVENTAAIRNLRSALDAREAGMALRAEIPAPEHAQPVGAALESIINASNTFNDLWTWTDTLQTVARSVCLVKTPGSTGTGFLVADDLVLTNYHVIEGMMGVNGAAPGGSKVIFDYKAVVGEGAPVLQGKEHRLADDWLVDHSPYSQIDLQDAGLNAARDAEELDYALLRLEESAATEQRKPIELPDAVNPRLDTPLFVIQHPEGRPIKLAFSERGVLAVTNDKLRIRHAVSTLGGSSGSPCLDDDLNPIALHHSGDPAWTPGLQARHNAAIPLDRVKRLLNARGHIL